MIHYLAAMALSFLSLPAYATIRPTKHKTWPLKKQVRTSYATFEVTEHSILSIITHPAFKRMSSLDCYGATTFFSRDISHKRSSHALGTYYILKQAGASLLDQVAGLLYQITIPALVRTYNEVVTIDPADQHAFIISVLTKNGLFDVLEKCDVNPDLVVAKILNNTLITNDDPAISAAHIDLVLHAGIATNRCSKSFAEEIINNVFIHEGAWYFASATLAEEYANLAAALVQTEWSSPDHAAIMHWIEEAITTLLAEGTISVDNLFLESDASLFVRINKSKNNSIKNRLRYCKNPTRFYTEVSASTFPRIARPCFRMASDPSILLSSGIAPTLTSLKPAYKKVFDRLNRRTYQGIIFRITT